MKEIDGDLIQLTLQGSFDVTIHGCNCFCEMGGGIAKLIKENFPEAYESDCATERGAANKLGEYSFADIQRNNVSFTVVNAYTQFHWSGEGVLVEYSAVEAVFRKIKQAYSGRRIAYPKIGAGLAHGDWNRIANIINKHLQDEDHTLVNYKP